MNAPLLMVENLHIRFGDVEVVKGVSFTVHENETLALVGESGSGKSTIALAILRLLEHEGGKITKGRIRLLGDEVLELSTLSEKAMQTLRGRMMAMVFQEPMTALNPVMAIGKQLLEVIRRHESLTRQEARLRAIKALDEVQLPSPELKLHQYPHELSGGQRQRVMIAMALAGRPRLLIADEPSTALDVTTQAEILALLRRLQAQNGMGVLFITHDMGIVGEMADRVVVLRHGQKVEEAATGALFEHPREAYTRMLVAAAPRLGEGSPCLPAPSAPVLQVRDLVTRYPGRRAHPFAARQTFEAVAGVSLEIGRGETLGLVGESGCGKSSLARSILRLAPIHSGSVFIQGRDITQLGHRQLMPIRRSIQMIFQDPFASLNPRLPAWNLITEPAVIHGLVREGRRRDLAIRLLDQVGLGRTHLERYPHQFSGGQRQRLCIARALSVEPSLIIADEPVSALDVSIARQITELMQELQRATGLSFLFISHDMAVVERISHRIAVMSQGRIVETGPTGQVLSAPQHDYTRCLIASVPCAWSRRTGSIAATAIETVQPLPAAGKLRPGLQLKDSPTRRGPLRIA